MEVSFKYLIDVIRAFDFVDKKPDPQQAIIPNFCPEKIDALIPILEGLSDNQVQRLLYVLQLMREKDSFLIVPKLIEHLKYLEDFSYAAGSELENEYDYEIFNNFRGILHPKPLDQWSKAWVEMDSGAF
jgi:hypothetical protein